MLKALLSLEDQTKARLFLVLFIMVAFLRFWTSHSADLMASWLAGYFLHAGQLDAVYSGVTHAFTLTPNPEWIAFLETTDYRGPVYPFIYPPLWAWLMGHMPTLQHFWVFMVLMTLVNACLLAATVSLAYRAARTSVPESVWVATCLLALSMTSIGNVSMMENQPHILVSFLLVLTIERLRSGAQTTAGMALALAASLKLFPAAFALAFLVLGQRRAFASFAILGAMLGGASIAVAGWPLHEAFLAELSGISDTILVTGMSFNLHSSIAQVFFADQLLGADVSLVGIEGSSRRDFHYLTAGPLAVLLARLALVASIAWSLWMLRRADDDTRYGLVWPLMITLTAITSPLSWVYYFIPAVAFVPVLYDRLGFREGRLAIGLMIVPISGPVAGAYLNAEVVANTHQLAGTVAMLGMTVAFISALKREPGQMRHGAATSLRDPITATAPARTTPAQAMAAE